MSSAAWQGSTGFKTVVSSQLMAAPVQSAFAGADCWNAGGLICGTATGAEKAKNTARPVPWAQRCGRTEALPPVRVGDGRSESNRDFDIVFMLDSCAA